MMPSWDRRMQLMQDLGDLVLYMHAPFDWRVRHRGVLIWAGDDQLVPEGQGNNPYAAADDHWRQLTAVPGTTLSFGLNGAAIWNESGWIIVRESIDDDDE
jgi:hypothetical protein